MPANPTGWLYTTSYRRILGLIRHETMADTKAPLLAVSENWSPVDDVVDQLPDERLQLILLCCHPALPVESRSALALRLVMGASTEQIARLFLVSKATMAARLTRAKKKIVATGIPLTLPVERALDERLDEVCRTIYLAFTAGYSPGEGADLLRPIEAGEAVRLAEILYELAPFAPQVEALLALLHFQHARRDARERVGQLLSLIHISEPTRPY